MSYNYEADNEEIEVLTFEVIKRLRN